MVDRKAVVCNLLVPSWRKSTEPPARHKNTTNSEDTICITNKYHYRTVTAVNQVMLLDTYVLI